LEGSGKNTLLGEKGEINNKLEEENEEGADSSSKQLFLPIRQCNKSDVKYIRRG
jgi:hypothetical protein